MSNQTKTLSAEQTTTCTATEHDNSRKNSNHSSSQSAQAQLVHLAKDFVLDGALLPPSEQAPIADRANKRERVSYLRKQKNLEAIIKKSLHYCSSDQRSPKPECDWFEQFTMYAENISNEMMQDLWAKILAVEVLTPGSFSIRTLKTFKEMNIATAKTFSKACHLAVKDTSGKNLRILTGCYHTPTIFNFWLKNRESSIPLSEYNFTYSDILSLCESGLVFKEETESFPLSKNETLKVSVNGKPIVMTANKQQTVLTFYKFTSVGNELARLIVDKEDKDYLNSLKKHVENHFVIHA